MKESKYEKMCQKILAECESVSSTLSSRQSTVENEAKTISLQTWNEIDYLIECEERIDLLIKSLKGKKLNISAVCIDLRSFYFKSEVFKLIPIALMNNNDTKLSLLSEKYFKCLYLVLIYAYDSSFNYSLFKLVLRLLNTALIHLNRVLLILINYFNENMTSSYYKNQLLAVELIQSKLSMENQDHMVEITNVMRNLLSTITELVMKYKITSIGNEIQGFFENIKYVTIEDIDLFFQGEVIRDQLLSSSSFKSEDDDISYVSFRAFKSASLNMAYYNKYSLTPPTVNSTNKYYTLVLDLDETLIHFKYNNSEEGKVLFRPYLFEFLKTVSQYYEIIVFTASTRQYADLILNLIEAKMGHKVFNHRLYREHTTYVNGKHVKDLKQIGRDLSRILIVDNNEEAFSNQKENGIKIASYFGISKNEHCLLKLEEILSSIAQIKPSRDIRMLLHKYKNEIMKNVTLI